MKTKTRLVLPLILSILLLGSLGWGGWLWYDSHVDRSGWVETEEGRYYRDFHGDPVSGWQFLAEGHYFFREDGTPLTGWQCIRDVTYYFEDDGVMAIGWRTLGGKTYYFGGDGARIQGWLYLHGEKYYLPDGILATGWQDIGGSRYYFDESGAMATGFLDLDGGRYYLGEDGVLLTGDLTLEENRYRFGSDGVMVTGWQEDGDGRRYFLEEGPMALGWTEVEGNRYFFDEDGLMATGWRQEGEYRYYLQPDGSAAVGPTEIDGQLHHFTPKGIEVVLVNAQNPVPGYYETNLVTVTEWRRVDERCYDALMAMLNDCLAAGIEYNFNSGYRTVKEQTLILETRTQEHMETYELTYEEALAKALETVAVPGTSEHHLGLAVDLLGEEAIPWFQEHCWDYGFIRRYYAHQEGWTGIIDEPWHFRYVGVEVAQDIRASGMSLEEYLGAEPVKPEKLG